jgi:hypothetical protein
VALTEYVSSYCQIAVLILLLYLGAYVCDYSSLDAEIPGVHVSVACAATCAFVTSELNGGRVDLARVPGGNGIYYTILLLYMLLF